MLKNHCSALGLAAAMALTAASQPKDFNQRLAEGQRLRNTDRFAEARDTHLALLRDVRQGAPNHRVEALVFDNLGLDEENRGDYGAAEIDFNQGLAAVSASSADTSIRTGLQTHLAELYIAESRAQDAEPLLRQAAHALQSAAMTDPLALSLANQDLAVACIVRHKFGEPEALLRESLVLLEQTLGPDSLRAAAVLLTYAGFLTSRRRLDDALAPAEHAWQILTSTSTPFPRPALASAASVLAAVYFHAGRLDDAQLYAKKAVEVAEASLGPQHPKLALYLSNYAAILKQAGRRIEAKAAEKRAEAIQSQHPATGSGYTINVASLR